MGVLYRLNGLSSCMATTNEAQHLVVKTLDADTQTVDKLQVLETLQIF